MEPTLQWPFLNKNIRIVFLTDRDFLVAKFHGEYSVLFHYREQLVTIRIGFSLSIA